MLSNSLENSVNDTVLLDSLLDDIYSHNCSVASTSQLNTESDTNTLRSWSTADTVLSASGQVNYTSNSLQSMAYDDLLDLRNSFSSEINQKSSKLVRLLKHRDSINRKTVTLANTLTAILQATSAKTGNGIHKFF